MKTGIALCLIGLLLTLLTIAGCSNSTQSTKTGHLRIYLADLPAQYDQVNIVVTKLEVHSLGSDSLSGWTAINNSTATYDLLTLRNGANAILGDTMLPVGKYTQIRLSIGDSSNVIVDGIGYILDISGSNIIKLNHNFDIVPGTLYALLLDFDAARSIHQTGDGQYQLDPVIRVEANDISGSISGTVNPVSAQAIVLTIAETDTVVSSCDSTSGSFRLVALPAGSYDLYITPADTAYSDTVITAVPVTVGQDKNIGIVILNHK